MRNRVRPLLGVIGGAIFVFSAAHADTNNVSVSFSFNGERMTINRNAPFDAALIEAASQSSENCINLCLAPFVAAPGVETIGEREVLEFLSDHVSGGDGLLVDARLPEAHQRGFIPASVNIPGPALGRDNPYRDDILRALGGRNNGPDWDFSEAFTLVLYSAGPANTDAITVINMLLQVGYPTEKLRFYRGGIQSWASLQFTTHQPQS